VRRVLNQQNGAIAKGLGGLFNSSQKRAFSILGTPPWTVEIDISRPGLYSSSWISLRITTAPLPQHAGGIGRRYWTGAIDCFWPSRPGNMQDPGYGPPRTPLLGTSVNNPRQVAVPKTLILGMCRNTQLCYGSYKGVQVYSASSVHLGR
jgi:hypothetical protein